MPRFTNGTTEIDTSNAVEIVRLRAAGYKPVETAASADSQPDGSEQTDGDAATDQAKRTRARR